MRGKADLETGVGMLCQVSLKTRKKRHEALITPAVINAYCHPSPKNGHLSSLLVAPIKQKRRKVTGGKLILDLLSPNMLE
jgi:hypothetical protein